MKKAEPEGIDWLEFLLPTVDDDGEATTISWRVHLNFLVSNWTCIYGRGCSGIFPKNAARIVPDNGCCGSSFWYNDVEDFDKVAKMVEQLTDQDMDADRLKYIQKHGYSNVYSIDRDENYINGKGKVLGGACVFANRADGSVGKTGKIGCAFHHLGERTSQPDHVDTMPRVCWQLPFKYDFDEDNEVNIIYAWDVDQWADPDDDGSHDSWCSWWCLDSSDAYIAESALYKRMEPELREMMGDEAYDRMCTLIQERAANTISPMPGSVRNEGRPMLPLIIGNRPPARTAPQQ